jgi:hypothetical protein
MRRMTSWLDRLDGAKLAVIECGAGEAIPTVRLTCQRIARDYGATLIRINTREADIPSGHVSLPLGALAALDAIDERLGRNAGAMGV